MNELLNHLASIKNLFCFLVGLIGGFFTYLLGGWTEGMKTLVILMVIDYISGVIVAAVFKNSSKTIGGGLNSNVGFKGLVKKFFELMIVAAMVRIDIMLGITYLRDLCIIGFVLNEMISITENAGLMGIPLPPVVTKAIELLNEKVGADNENITNRSKSD